MTTINAVNNILSGVTGSGTFVGATSPTLVTPTLGVATATSINFGGSALSSYVSNTSWTPTFTCDTPGDLSVSYATQSGYYSRVGSIVYVSFFLEFTPTFSTASGNMRVSSFPVQASANNYAFAPLLLSNVTYPAGVTNVFTYMDGSYQFTYLVGNKSAAAYTILTIAQIASGATIKIGGGFSYMAN